MPKLDVRPFKQGTSNADILDSIWKNASPDYQRRVPEATKAGVQDVLRNLTEYRAGWNEFVEALVNRIGLVIIKNNTWTNPYAKFKRGMMGFGESIEEVMVGLIKAKTYNHNRESLERDVFGNYPAEVQSSFHKINRQEMYPLTVNQALLQRAFLEEGGLGSFISALMSAPSTSDQWDEFLITAQLFREYYEAGGFHKVQVASLDGLTADSEDAKTFLRLTRTFAGNLQFMSTKYNAAGMPVAVDPDDLELFITPEALAAIDVEALAGAFNIDKAMMAGRINLIPKEHFNIPGAQAVLTTRDFFVIADTLFDSTNQWNPATLSTNFFLHHHGIYSASRFVPAILFTTEAGTDTEVIEPIVTGVSAITIADEDGTTVTSVERGQLYQVLVSAITDPADSDNDAVRLELAGAGSSHTRVNQLGTLIVSPSEPNGELTVTATAVDNDAFTNTVTVDVVGELLTLWPEPNVLADDDNDGLLEVIPERPQYIVDESSPNNGKLLIPSIKGVKYRKAGVDVGNGTTHTIAADTAFTAVTRDAAKYEIKPGADASWTIEPLG